MGKIENAQKKAREAQSFDVGMILYIAVMNVIAYVLREYFDVNNVLSFVIGAIVGGSIQYLINKYVVKPRLGYFKIKTPKMAYRKKVFVSLIIVASFFGGMYIGNLPGLSIFWRIVVTVTAMVTGFGVLKKCIKLTLVLHL